MNIGKNISKYRKQQNLTQEELAEKLNISRQSISKWENEENLPSIDNLIILSGLLEVSLDELITGETYLQFPLEFGEIKFKKLTYLFLLFPTILAIIMLIPPFQIFNENKENILMALITQTILYPLFIILFPFKKSRLYTHWTLTKKGIIFPIYKINSVTEYYLPIKEIFNRQTNFIEYKNIESIHIDLDLFKLDPSIGIGLYGYSPRNTSLMMEPFNLILKTKDNKEVFLDISGYYQPDSTSRKMLYPILLFLKRKQIPINDKQNLLPQIKNRDCHIEEIYK